MRRCAISVTKKATHRLRRVRGHFNKRNSQAHGMSMRSLKIHASLARDSVWVLMLDQFLNHSVDRLFTINFFDCVEVCNRCSLDTNVCIANLFFHFFLCHIDSIQDSSSVCKVWTVTLAFKNEARMIVRGRKLLLYILGSTVESVGSYSSVVMKLQPRDIHRRRARTQDVERQHHYINNKK